jgi:hypothetical protein
MRGRWQSGSKLSQLAPDAAAAVRHWGMRNTGSAISDHRLLLLAGVLD